jgi:hypothetical protein
LVSLQKYALKDLYKRTWKGQQFASLRMQMQISIQNIIRSEVYYYRLQIMQHIENFQKKKLKRSLQVFRTSFFITIIDFYHIIKI